MVGKQMLEGEKATLKKPLLVMSQHKEQSAEEDTDAHCDGGGHETARGRLWPQRTVGGGTLGVVGVNPEADLEADAQS